MISLAEHDILSLLLSSNDEVSNWIIASSEDSVLIEIEVESHVSLVTSLLVPAVPDLSLVHGQLEVTGHALKIPLASDGTTLKSSTVVHCVLTVVLLYEVYISVW
jgi:hypothetical protein